MSEVFVQYTDKPVSCLSVNYDERPILYKLVYIFIFSRQSDIYDETLYIASISFYYRLSEWLEEIPAFSF